MNQAKPINPPWPDGYLDILKPRVSDVFPPEQAPVMDFHLINSVEFTDPAPPPVPVYSSVPDAEAKPTPSLVRTIASRFSGMGPLGIFAWMVIGSAVGAGTVLKLTHAMRCF